MILTCNGDDANKRITQRFGRGGGRFKGGTDRANKLLKYISKRLNGKITTRMYWSLIELLAYKYFSTKSSECRYIYDWSLSDRSWGTQLPIHCVSDTRPIKHNKYCIRARRKSDEDALYFWDDDNGNTKIGITSSRIGESRIKICARSRGTNYSNLKIVNVTNARHHESILLDRFQVKPYDSGDGYTEFRTLSDNEREDLIEYFHMLCK